MRSALSSDGRFSSLLLPWGRGEPIRLDVRLTSSDEVDKLREQVKQLQEEIAVLSRSLTDVEFKYRSECIVNLELQDLLRLHGIPYRAVLKGRH